MVAPAAGQVVLVRFPFSDLSQSKQRPAVVLAHAGRGDYVLCQVTSRPYGDPMSVAVEQSAFESGSLEITSYARPGKLFTAHSSLITAHVGTLTADMRARIVDAVVSLLRPAPASFPSTS